MLESRAADLADKIVISLIQHQPEALAKGALESQERALEVAQAIASLRLSLVQQLTQQPN